MRKDEEKQKQSQSTESNSVFSSFAGVVKNLMVKTPAEPDLANRRATEMMQRMKTVENLGKTAILQHTENSFHKEEWQNLIVV